MIENIERFIQVVLKLMFIEGQISPQPLQFHSVSSHHCHKLHQNHSKIKGHARIHGKAELQLNQETCPWILKLILLNYYDERELERGLMDVCGLGKASIKIYSDVSLYLILLKYRSFWSNHGQWWDDVILQPFNPIFLGLWEEKPHCHTYHDFLDFCVWTFHQ